jgi:predicted transposase YbfD/YdcC
MRIGPRRVCNSPDSDAGAHGYRIGNSGLDISVAWRYYIASPKTSAAQSLRHKRTHWRCENALHWVLDIACREDESRLRKDHRAQNFAILRHIAPNLLTQETTCKLGSFNKRPKAARDPDHLLIVLATLFK